MNTPALSWHLNVYGLVIVVGLAIAAILFLTIKLKMHALITLFSVSILTAVAVGIPLESMISVISGGFGATLAQVGLLVSLGAMIGRLLLVSGSADVIADYLVCRVGPKYAPLAFSLLALVFGLPLFFYGGSPVLLPIIFTVARRLGGNLMLYGFPVAIGFLTLHTLLPPHDTPSRITQILGADLGLVVAIGLAVATPTWYLAGYLLSRYLGSKYPLPLPELPPAQTSPLGKKPKLWVIMSVLLLPMILIASEILLHFLISSGLAEDELWVRILRTLGQPPITLLITLLVAIVVLGRGRLAAVESVVNSALGVICSLILITGAGGMLAAVLDASGIAQSLAGFLVTLGMPVLVAGFVIAAVVKLAQGSTVIAFSISAGLIAQLAFEQNLNPVQLAALVLAIASGSVFAGHVNDPLFWLVNRMFSMDIKTTLKTWTVGQAAISALGFSFSGLVYLVASFT